MLMLCRTTKKLALLAGGTDSRRFTTKGALNIRRPCNPTNREHQEVASNHNNDDSPQENASPCHPAMHPSPTLGSALYALFDIRQILATSPLSGRTEVL